MSIYTLYSNDINKYKLNGWVILFKLPILLNPIHNHYIIGKKETKKQRKKERVERKIERKKER